MGEHLLASGDEKDHLQNLLRTYRQNPDAFVEKHHPLISFATLQERSRSKSWPSYLSTEAPTGLLAL
jgi:hypothetical protein